MSSKEKYFHASSFTRFPSCTMFKIQNIEEKTNEKDDYFFKHQNLNLNRLHNRKSVTVKFIS